MCAPRARAVSSRSITNIHAPSASTKPSRSCENGRDAVSGASLRVFEMMRMMQKPVITASVIVASAPPQTM